MNGLDSSVIVLLIIGMTMALAGISFVVWLESRRRAKKQQKFLQKNIDNFIPKWKCPQCGSVGGCNSSSIVGTCIPFPDLKDVAACLLCGWNGYIGDTEVTNAN
jgi:hypothetical protein